jgi:hypothetical protein
MQVYSGPCNRNVDSLVMWFAERNGEKWGVIESAEMVLSEIFR